MAGPAPRLAAEADALLSTLLPPPALLLLLMMMMMVCPVAAKLAVPDADLYFKTWGHPDPDTYFFGPGARSLGR
jgi:hypothetical protein